MRIEDTRRKIKERFEQAIDNATLIWSDPYLYHFFIEICKDTSHLDNIRRKVADMSDQSELFFLTSSLGAEEVYMHTPRIRVDPKELTPFFNNLDSKVFLGDIKKADEAIRNPNDENISRYINSMKELYDVNDIKEEIKGYAIVTWLEDYEGCSLYKDIDYHPFLPEIIIFVEPWNSMLMNELDKIRNKDPFIIEQGEWDPVKQEYEYYEKTVKNVFE